MSRTAREARGELFPLIKRVNDDHDAVEIVSRYDNAVRCPLRTTRRYVKA